MTADAGIPMARSTVAVQAALDTEGCLDEDCCCRKCGYNLRGLPLNGRCPECGTAVGRSLQGDYLHFAEPRWVRTLASGMNWIFARVVLSLLVTFIGGGILNFRGDRVSFGIGVMFSSRAGLFLYGTGVTPAAWNDVAQLCVVLVGVVGYWMLSTPDPAGIERPSCFTARKLIRSTQAAGLVMLAIAWLIPVSSVAVVLILVGLDSAVGIVSMFATLCYTRQLALRIPDEKLARRCRLMMWFFVLLSLMGCVWGASTTLYAPCVTQAVLGATLVGILLFLFGASLLIFRFRRAFKKAARLAVATWAAPQLAEETAGTPSVSNDQSL